MKNNLILSFLFFSFILVAQNEVSTFFIGNSLVDFRPPALSVTFPVQMSTTECATSICSPAGDLLFYSNGGKSPTSSHFGGIWNKNHDIMDNGVLGTDSSGCTSSFQGSIIVPFPAGLKKLNADLYYLFNKDCLESSFSGNDFNAGLNYCVIDMNENDGLGKVVQKNVPLVPHSVVSAYKTNHEPVSAILHGNNIDYWLFSYNNDSLYRLLITEEGISGFTSLDVGEGRIVISPARQFLCAGSKVYELNSFTGEITFLANLPNMTKLTFSPDGTKLYGVEDNKTYQMDMNQVNFLETKTLIANVGMGLFLAPNHKIYLFTNGSSSFSGEIRCPNSVAEACQFSFTTTSLAQASTGAYSNVMAHYLFYQGACTVGLDENKPPLSVQVFPNPTNELIHLSSEQEIKQIDLVNLQGQLLLSEQLNASSCSIQTSHLAEGIYLVRIVIGKELIQQKIQIIR